MLWSRAFLHGIVAYPQTNFHRTIITNVFVTKLIAALLCRSLLVVVHFLTFLLSHGIIDTQPMSLSTHGSITQHTLCAILMLPVLICVHILLQSYISYMKWCVSITCTLKEIEANIWINFLLRYMQHVYII